MALHGVQFAFCEFVCYHFKNMPPDDSRELHCVTGAFGFSGRYIARRLLDANLRVRTLTRAPQSASPFGEAVEVRPLDFEPLRLAENLRGVAVLYNTYWVRYNRPEFSRAGAFQNTVALFQAARNAGVRRVVHVSIANPSEDSPFEYFRCKALMERALRESGLGYAILRPAVLFGPDDILINNIAWMLRHFPVFGVFAGGNYRIDPIFVDDLAKLAVEQGLSSQNATLDAVGPESFTYRELARTLGEIIGKPRPVVSIPPGLGLLLAGIMGFFVRDVILTRDEIDGLTAGLLHVDTPPTGATRLSEWAKAHASELGKRYHSELARRKGRRQV